MPNAAVGMVEVKGYRRAKGEVRGYRRAAARSLSKTVAIAIPRANASKEAIEDATLTARQQTIIQEITVSPHLTVGEYADRLLISPKNVNSVLLNTREGRALAEAGLICITPLGQLPRWATQCTNKHLIMIRKRQPQLTTLGLPQSIRGDARAKLEDVIAEIQEITIATTSRRMKGFLDRAVLSLIASRNTAASK